MMGEVFRQREYSVETKERLIAIGQRAEYSTQQGNSKSATYKIELRLNSDIELDLDGAKCSGSVAELLRSIKSRRTMLI
jgi:hypothetical protein